MRAYKRIPLAALASLGGLAAFALANKLIAVVVSAMWDQAGFSAWRTYQMGFSPLAPRSGQIFGLFVIAIVFFRSAYTGMKEDKENPKSYLVDAAIAAVSFILVIAMFIGIMTDGKLKAAGYMKATSIEYDGKLPAPQILNRLLTGQHDLHPTVVKDKKIDLLKEGFEERPASLAGATKVMSERATGDSKADILDESFAYIADTEGSGRWTAIRDGSGKRIPADSIVEWDGAADSIRQCRFEGENELSVAVTGNFSNSLSDHVRRALSGSIYWSLADVYGYCDASQDPVIVIPVKTDQWNGSSSIEVPAGVVTVRGSSSGTPDIEYQRSVKPGEIPGPVYPISIAREQRDQVNWSAGRKWAANGFGFEPVTIDSNVENPGEYVLKSQKDGRMYYVTPLTPRSSRSQAIIGLNFVSSDYVEYGKLNTNHVQVRNQDEKGLFTEQDLDRRARDILRKVDETFMTSGQKGELQEYIPSADGSWTVFAVQSGQPRYLLRISPNQLDQAVELDGGKIGEVLAERGDAEKPGSSKPSGSDKPLDGLSDAQLQAEMDAAIARLEAVNAERKSRQG